MTGLAGHRKARRNICRMNVKNISPSESSGVQTFLYRLLIDRFFPAQLNPHPQQLYD
jgi:hypothetical protein